MADPSQLSGAFVSGPEFEVDEINVEMDLIPYLKNLGNGTFIQGTVSPLALLDAADGAITPTIESPQDDDEPDVTDPLAAEITEFDFPGDVAPTATTWNLRLSADEATVWESRDDPVNIFTIEVPADTMTAATEYILSVRCTGPNLRSTRRASVTFTTAA